MKCHLYHLNSEYRPDEDILNRDCVDQAILHLQLEYRNRKPSPDVTFRSNNTIRGEGTTQGDVRLEQALIRIRGSDGSTVLHYVIREGFANVAIWLLDRGSDINATNDRMQTALHVAAFVGDPDMVRLLLDRGANVDVYAENLNPLQYAVCSGDKASVRLLLDGGADINARSPGENASWVTALHAGICAFRNNLLPFLLKNGADANANEGGPTGMTPMHLAARMGNVIAVQALWTHGANLSPRDGNGDTPLHHAVKFGRERSVAILLEIGVNCLELTREGWTPMAMAVVSGKCDILKMLLEKGADRMTEAQKVACLAQAAGRGKLSAMHTLFERGLPLDMPLLGQRRNALHIAALNGHEEMVKFLLRRGALTTVPDIRGATALSLALGNGKTVVADLIRRAEREMAQNPNVQLFEGQIKFDDEQSLRNVVAQGFANLLGFGCGRVIIANPDPPALVEQCPSCKNLSLRLGLSDHAEVVHYVKARSLIATADDGRQCCKLLRHCLDNVKLSVSSGSQIPNSW